MLSVFPYFLTYSAIGTFLIRIILGLVLLHWTYVAWKKSSKTAGTKGLSLIEGIVGLLLIIGLWTQVAALIAIVDLIIRVGHKISKKAFLTDGVNYYLILLVLAISLFFTGAGFWAFDYPL